MVNLIMRVTGDETLTMSRSFLMKKYNYSHCPLKKRPVQYIKEERYDVKDLSDDNSEPENLSTKPEDLSKSCKTLTPPPAVALISIKKENEEELGSNVHCNQPTERAFGRYLSKSSGGPLEPLNLNTAVNTHEPPTTPQWPRAVPAHYPPHYIPLNYIYPQHDVLPYYYSSATAASPSPPRISAEPVVSPYAAAAAAAAAVHDPCSSPPRHAFAPFRSHVPVIAALPHCGSGAESRLYRPQAGDHSPLSPTSTTSSNSYPYYADPSPPPPVSPEDLSSPGSVSSLCGDSSSVGSSIGGSGSGRTTATTASSCTSVGAGAKKKCKDALQRYKCTYCAKSYSTYSGLSKHQQFHCSANEDAAAKKKFKCKYCEKEYNSLGALKMHIRTHTLPCKCTQCGKAFSRPWLLQGHIRTHTGEKPFSCPHCNRAFADRSNLRAHLQTHSDVKKYSCPTCSKTFSRMSLLSKHTDGGCPGVSGGVIRVTDDIKSFYINN